MLLGADADEIWGREIDASKLEAKIDPNGSATEWSLEASGEESCGPCCEEITEIEGTVAMGSLCASKRPRTISEMLPFGEVDVTYWLVAANSSGTAETRKIDYESSRGASADGERPRAWVPQLACLIMRDRSRVGVEAQIAA